MIAKISQALSDACYRNNLVGPEEKIIVEYGLLCFIEVVIQAIVFLILGVLLDCLLEIAVVAAVFALAKSRIGGWHAASQLSCLCVTTLLVLAGLIPAYVDSRLLGFALLAVATASLLLLAPIPHPNNPLTPAELQAAKKPVLLLAAVCATVLTALLLGGRQHLALLVIGGLFISTMTLWIPNKSEVIADD